MGWEEYFIMNKKIKLGLFFILTIALLVIGIIGFGKIKLSSSGYKLYIDYVFTGDLRINGKVAYRGGGIVIGYIDDIQVNEDGTLRVTAIITDKNIILPEGTLFTIQAVGFGLGEKYIMSTPPVVDTYGMKGIVPNSIVRGVDPISLETTLSSVDVDNVNQIISDVYSVLNSLSSIMLENDQNITSSIHNINNTFSNVSDITGKLSSDDKLYSDIQETIANLKDFSKEIKDNPSSLLFAPEK